MGYHVKPVRSVAKDPVKRARTRAWKLQLIKMTNGVNHTRDIPEGEYRQHGFTPSMTIAQAKHQKKLANEKLKREASEIHRIQATKRMTDIERAHFLYLREEDVREFESQVLFRRLARSDADLEKRNKINYHWSTVKEILCEMKLDPSEWGEEYWKFYNFFAEKQFSLAYVKKLLRVINAWGYFCARKHGKPFLPIPSPRGMDRAHIANAHHKKKQEYKRQGKQVNDASALLTPEILKKTKRKFTKPENHNWLHVSLWFGLRPEEVDALSDPTRYRIEYDRKIKKKVIWVYQPKLVTLTPDQRWKAIPCLYPEQAEAIEMIESGKIAHPARLTIRAWLGEEYSSYAGRKGFEDLMATVKGHPLEVVAEWMGHQSIERTWKNYRNRKRVRI